MAEDMPTPASPHARRDPQPDVLTNGNLDIGHDEGPGAIDSPPVRRLLRSIEQHDKEFNENLAVLTKFVKMLAFEHAKSIQNLKKDCMKCAGGNYSHHQRRLPTTGSKPTVEASPSVAPRQAKEATETSVANGTSEQLDSGTEPRHVETPALESTPQIVARRGTSEPLSKDNRTEIIQSPDPEEPPGQEDETSSVDEADNYRAPFYFSDDDNHDQDIVHEESPVPDETAWRTTPPIDDGNQDQDVVHEESPVPVETAWRNVRKAQPTVPPKTPKAQNRREHSSLPKKSSQSLRDSSRRWTDEEESFMIETIYDLMQGEDLGPTKSHMWKRAAAILSTRGYDRTYQQMMAKWSYDTRHKCESRGLDWAAAVMAKVPHMTRKRRSSMNDNSNGKQTATPTDQPRAKRTKAKSRKLRAPVSSSARSGSHMYLRFIWGHASSDIVQVDWSPDSKHFAAASNSIIESSKKFQNNRRGNLIYGSVPSKMLRDLPEHRIFGNAAAGEPKYIYQTVSAVRFTPTGNRLLSAGFDSKVRVWDVGDEASIHCKTEIQYSQRLEVMDVAGEQSTLFATGTEGGLRSIRVFFMNSEVDVRPQEIKMNRETGRKSFPFSPTCLRFGHAGSRDWLLAGFGNDVNGHFGGGCIAMWKFREGSCEHLHFPQGDTYVFDCAWNPTGDLFAVGSTSNALTRREPGEHSVVKLYSPNQPDSISRYSCRAKDINDVTIDHGLVTASCTNGSTYVWDQRQPQKPLHRLAHGQPVIRIPPGKDREVEDVGVRYIEWSHTRGQLYTGSSDGILKYWDTRRSPADVFVEDLVDTGSEILCGRLSPDHSSLLLGSEEGGLYLLSKSNGPFQTEDLQYRVAELWDNDN
ncbi:hypothetical protein AYO21_00530 [Fonsecaea monophora]|uniref:Uncharacterized protein n=1 Tax=Fonsecaea monophora TaxID=254056 RepID=A0A177FPC0_9EURO|nr:hypothetical protein AYO21_00530 [Fonsecaea monophora]OAG45182.1 hypothetical protein AYO21_00530 [Fonsecaea monophora]